MPRQTAVNFQLLAGCILSIAIEIIQRKFMRTIIAI